MNTAMRMTRRTTVGRRSARAPLHQSKNAMSTNRRRSEKPCKPLHAVADPESGPPTPIEQFVELLPDLSTLALRVGAAALTPHHGLDKLGNAEGFANFVVAKHLAFLPFPLVWTYAAIAAQVLAPIGLALGIRRFGFSRLCSAALCGCMIMATIFHIDENGLEGFPLGIVEAHSYGYELSGLYALVFAYFTAAGPGRLSIGPGSDDEK